MRDARPWHVVGVDQQGNLLSVACIIRGRVFNDKVLIVSPHSQNRGMRSSNDAALLATSAWQCEVPNLDAQGGK